MNDLIDKMIGYLMALKEKGDSKGERVFFRVESGGCTLSVEYKVGSGRLSVHSANGDTELNFNNRKLNTISGISGCLAKAVFNAKEVDKGKPIVVKEMTRSHVCPVNGIERMGAQEDCIFCNN